MFRKIYKEANDDILPDPRLLDKILSEKPSKRHHINRYTYGSVAAAVLIFAGTLAIYPQISENIDPKNETVLTVQDTTPQNVTSQAIEQNENSEVSLSSEAFEEKATENVSENIQKSDSASSANAEAKKTKNTEKTPKSTPSVSQKENESSVQSHAITQEIQSNDDFVSPSYKHEAVQEKKNKITPSAVKEIPSNVAETAIPTALAEQASEVQAASYSIEKHESEKAVANPGGGSSKISPRTAVSAFTKEDAEYIADEQFLSDFGEAFISETTISTENTDNSFSVTRSNDDLSYTIKVNDDGSFEKQY